MMAAATRYNYAMRVTDLGQSRPHPPDCCFVETYDGESAEQWRAAVEDILAHLWADGSAPGWWQPFTAGPVVGGEGCGRRSGREVRAIFFDEDPISAQKTSTG